MCLLLAIWASKMPELGAPDAKSSGCGNRNLSQWTYLGLEPDSWNPLTVQKLLQEVNLLSPAQYPVQFYDVRVGEETPDCHLIRLELQQRNLKPGSQFLWAAPFDFLTLFVTRTTGLRWTNSKRTESADIDVTCKRGFTFQLFKVRTFLTQKKCPVLPSSARYVLPLIPLPRKTVRSHCTCLLYSPSSTHSVC